MPWIAGRFVVFALREEIGALLPKKFSARSPETRNGSHPSRGRRAPHIALPRRQHERAGKFGRVDRDGRRLAEVGSLERGDRLPALLIDRNRHVQFELRRVVGDGDARGREYVDPDDLLAARPPASTASIASAESRCPSSPMKRSTLTLMSPSTDAATGTSPR